MPGTAAVASSIAALARDLTLGPETGPAAGTSVGAAPTIDEERIGMTLFQRAHDIVAAKANKALDAAEKPDEMLDLSYEQMLDQITQVRRALVAIAASRKQIELQEQQLQHSVDHLQDQAKAALVQGREDLAREALSRKAAAQQQIDAMEPQHQQLTEEEQKLEQTLAALQKRVNNFRTQKEVLKAQYTAAQAETSVNESAAGISKTFGDSGAALQRAQDKIAQMQARAGAVDELLAVRRARRRRRRHRRHPEGTRRGRHGRRAWTRSWPRSRPRSAPAATAQRRRRRSPGADAPGHRPGRPTHTVLMLQNSRMPWYESSRPWPERLDAAERQLRVGGHVAVDEDHPGVEVADEPAPLGVVAGPRVGAEPELGAVGQLDRLVDVRRPGRGWPPGRRPPRGARACRG